MRLIKTTAPDLFRDADNGAIICTDVNTYQNYKLARNNSYHVSDLEKQLSELKELLINNKMKVTK